eukprot:g494.t1
MDSKVRESRSDLQCKYSVKVIVRVRPNDATAKASDTAPAAENFEQGGFIFDLSKNLVCAKSQPKVDQNGVESAQKSKRHIIFGVDDILPQKSSQEQVYNRCVAHAVDRVLSGFNATIMAYGQTGSGKTFTMSGPSATESSECFSMRGLVPRALEHVLRQASSAGPTHRSTVRISCAEIYNEKLFDLIEFEDVASEGSLQNLDIVQDSHGNIVVKSLSRPVVSTVDEAMGYFFEAQTNRAIAEHELNKASSRSHCVFTIYVENDTEDGVRLSKLHLIDLAGSERLSMTKSTGEIAKQAQYINKSLTFLEQVVVALVEKSRGVSWREHIPYRSSKLTHLLKDSLGGNSITVMLATLWPRSHQHHHFSQTMSTLRFATRMRKVQNLIHRERLVKGWNRSTRVIMGSKEEQSTSSNASSAEIKSMREEIKQLRRELAMHDVISGKTDVSHRPLSQRSKRALQLRVNKFIKHGPEKLKLKIDSVREMDYVHSLLREAVLNAASSTDEKSIEQSSHTVPDNNDNEVDHSVSKSESKTLLKDKSSSITERDEEGILFDEFKRTIGSSHNEALKKAKALLRAKRDELKEKKAAVVFKKKVIDEILAEIQNNERERTDFDENYETNREQKDRQTLSFDDWEDEEYIGNSSEYADTVSKAKDNDPEYGKTMATFDKRAADLVQKLKNGKSEYRGVVQQFKEQRVRMEYVMRSLNTCRETLLFQFQKYLASQGKDLSGQTKDTQSRQTLHSSRIVKKRQDIVDENDLGSTLNNQLPAGSALDAINYEREFSQRIAQKKSKRKQVQNRRHSGGAKAFGAGYSER